MLKSISAALIAVSLLTGRAHRHGPPARAKTGTAPDHQVGGIERAKLQAKPGVLNANAKMSHHLHHRYHRHHRFHNKMSAHKSNKVSKATIKQGASCDQGAADQIAPRNQPRPRLIPHHQPRSWSSGSGPLPLFPQWPRAGSCLIPPLAPVPRSFRERGRSIDRVRYKPPSKEKQITEMRIPFPQRRGLRVLRSSTFGKPFERRERQLGTLAKPRSARVAAAGPAARGLRR